VTERLTESTVEDAALSWLETLGWSVKHGPEIARTLAALRDALLPKLISGALRVADAEAFLKERGL